MKMEGRCRVDGTEITIGRRVSKKGGKQSTSRTYSAEYRDDSGKQICESLGTTNLAEAKRGALAIHARLSEGRPRIAENKLTIEELITQYMLMVQVRGLAPKTEAKYRSDLKKLSDYCTEQRLVMAHRFDRDAFYRYRQWLTTHNYADKTIYGVLILCKQVFKWAHQEGKLSDYPIGTVKVSKARAKPQACFTTGQVEQILAATDDAERAAFATLAYAGLRVGELIQLQWPDVLFDRGDLGMFYIRRGGSMGTTKDKDHRFIPIHPRIKPLIEALPRSSNLVFPAIKDRRLLIRLKKLCAELGFPNPNQYKVHSFRHHFASLCANHQVAYRKALVWLGHSSSEILDLYYHLTDADSQAAMLALANDTTISNRPEHQR